MNNNEFWVPLIVQINSKNQRIRTDKFLNILKSYIRISNRGNIKFYNGDLEVLMNNNILHVDDIIIKKQINKKNIILKIKVGNKQLDFNMINLFIKSLAGLDLRNYTCAFIDNDETNIVTSNILINNRKIVNACLFRYKNSIELTEFETLFYSEFSEISNKKLKKLRKFKINSNKENKKIRDNILNKIRDPNKCFQQQRLFFDFKEKSFYILDFYCPFLKICIEIDGLHHYSNIDQVKHDKIRDKSIESKAIKIIRFSNNLISNEIRRKYIIEELIDLMLIKTEIEVQKRSVGYEIETLIKNFNNKYNQINKYSKENRGDIKSIPSITIIF